MSVTSQPSSTFQSIDPALLKPHPNYLLIYGEEVDLSDLVNLIRNFQYPRPLLVNQNNTIVSGYPYWKAALSLGWSRIDVEVRQFPNEEAELEALLLENADRNKTNEQKVREAIAWEQIEKAKAKQRQQFAASSTNQKLGRNIDKTLVENLPHASKGLTRDKVAQLVGLGSGRNYAKARNIVTTIDKLIQSGDSKSAFDLRSCLNEQSVDAANRLLKGSLPKKNIDTQERSCWNCEFCSREQTENNHTYYCYKFGLLNFLKQDASSRGADCSKWSYRLATESENNSIPNPEYFNISLPSHLQALIEDAARAESMALADWIYHHLLKAVNLSETSMGIH